MATVTDLYGTENSVGDYASVELPDDSNVNVFEFGNMILADILPSLLWVKDIVIDGIGTSNTATNSYGSIISMVDEVGSQSSIVDMSGS